MASPQVVIFVLYDESTGVPLTGATPVFDTYKDDTGTNIAQPAITEVGGGAYKFAPVFPTNKGLVYVIDGGAGSSPRRQAAFLRPEDFYLDIIKDLQDETLGEWRIFTSGVDANRMVLYKQDGSVLKKFDLQNSSGSPTTSNPFRRIPV